MSGGAADGRALLTVLGTVTDHLADHLGLGVNEGHGGTSDDLVGGLVTDVVGKGLLVRGDEDGNGTVDTAGDNTLVEGEDNGEGRATDEHLTEDSLE